MKRWLALVVVALAVQTPGHADDKQEKSGIRGVTRESLRSSIQKNGEVTGVLAKSGIKNATSLAVRILLLADDNSKNAVDFENHVFEVGQHFLIEIECDSDLYVYLFHEGPDGKRSMLMPNPKFDDKRTPMVAKGTKKVLPDDGTGFVVVPPSGKEKLLIFASAEPQPNLTPEQAFKQNRSEADNEVVRKKTDAQIKDYYSRAAEWLSQEIEDEETGAKAQVVGSKDPKVKPRLFKEIVLQSK